MAKAWSWSFSKLKNYEECPKRHYEVDLAKSVKEEATEQLLWGNQVHDGMKNALIRTAPLPDSMTSYQTWVDRVLAGPGQLLVEQKWAIDKNFNKTSWFADNAWFRGIADAARINDNVGLAIDWKTGRMKPDNYRPQLMMLSMCMFAHFPALTHVRTELVWLQEEDCTTSELFSRASLNKEWLQLMGRVTRLESAAKNMDYPPMPGRLCEKYCPVMACPFHGKRQAYRR